MSDMAELLKYDRATGHFFWIKTGKYAGSPHKHGYVTITIKGKKYLAHRLAWLFVKGVWPSGVIDHKDRNPANNRIENLRDTNQSINGLNQGLRTTNSSGFKGVSLHQGRWKARKAGCYIGMFSTREQAAAAYEAYNV